LECLVFCRKGLSIFLFFKGYIAWVFGEEKKMKKIVSKIIFALTVFALAFTFFGSVSFKANAQEVRVERTLKANDTEYKLVTSKSQLVVGRKVILAANNANYAVSANQGSSYRMAEAVTKSGDICTPSTYVGLFTLANGTKSGTYGFYDDNYGYLYSTSNGTLKADAAHDGYSSFTLTFSTNGSVSAKVYSKTLYLKYYSGSVAFATSTSKSYISIYQAEEATTTPETPTTVSVTGVTLDKTSASLKVGNTLALTATVKPSNASNKNVSWSSSNTSVATVSNGVVTAKAQGSATITVTTADGGYKAYATITVTKTETTEPETPSTTKDAWTIMIYMCGADLESNYGLATSDIKEILSVYNQPSDVNILIQTGGAKKWNSTYSINASYLQRYHVANRKLVLDANLQKANMGLTSTFQSFLEWGLTNYPAEKTGVIMWNHGGAMRGVCYDENFSDDSLLNSEVKSAVANAFTNTKQTKKLEFIGYDACLMSVQDIAEFNSSYFNYMIASEESESGYGWDYDTWVDDLYAKKSTSVILKAVVDGFIKDNGGTSSSSNNQTLAYLNLANMAAYKTAWETLATKLSSKVTSSNKSSFNTLVKSVKHYADSDYTYFGIFDAKDFINKLASNSTFNPGSTYTNAVLTAFNNLVEYSSCGKGAGNSNGLCMYYPIASTCYKGTYYTAAQTNFSNWRSFVNTYGA
jgi:uncharacterized protein YjdB